MKPLTLIASLIGSIAFLGAFVVATSHPDGHFDKVEAMFSPGLDHLFWMNQKAGEFAIFDLEKKKLSPPSQFDLRHPEWARDGNSILALRHDDTLNRYRFATIDPEKLEISKGGEPASFFVQSSDSNLLFFGRGDYMEDTGHFDIHGFSSHSLEGTSPGVGGYAMAKLSSSGELLAVSMWGYNEPDRFEIFRLKDWLKVIDAKHEASFAFFLPGGRHLIAVESTAAQIALHHYDLETGELLKATRESSGWCEAAALSPDGKTLAIGTLNYDSEPQIELFSTDTLTLLKARSIDGGREVLDLAFEPAGDSLLAITRSGEVWRWRLPDRELVEITRIIPKQVDSRWIPVSVGLGVYVAFWVLLLFMRRRRGNDDPSPRTFVPGKSWLLGVIVFEVLYLLLNISSAISYGGIFLASAHLVLAGAAVLFLISSAILRLRTNYPVGIGFTAILVVGALLGFMIVNAAISSV